MAYETCAYDVMRCTIMFEDELPRPEVPVCVFRIAEGVEIEPFEVGD